MRQCGLLHGAAAQLPESCSPAQVMNHAFTSFAGVSLLKKQNLLASACDPATERIIAVSCHRKAAGELLACKFSTTVSLLQVSLQL